MKNKQLIKEIILIIVSFILGGIFMIFLLKFTNINNNVSTNKYINKSTTYEKNSLAPSISKIEDATVLIKANENEKESGIGSGFVYKKDDKYGYILTNEHIISDKDVKVVFSSNEETKAEVLGEDKYLDLAVLRVDKKYINLVATLGKSDNSNVGDTIFTIGCPVNDNYRGTVTAGIISGKNRLVTTTTDKSVNPDWMMKVIQIDAPINPGNSGGPLLNINGEVIGICTMKLIDTELEGMGFAISIEDAEKYIDDLEKGNKITWPSLGIEMSNVDDTSAILRNDLKVNNKINYGVVVLGIKDNSAAKDSNLKKGDIIIKVDDTVIQDKSYLKYEIYSHKANDKIKITYLRNNKEHTTTLVLK